MVYNSRSDFADYGVPQTLDSAASESMEPANTPDEHTPAIDSLTAEIEAEWTPTKADELASRLASRGGMLSNQGKLDDAMLDLDRAIGDFERLVEREGHGNLAYKLGLSLLNRGITLCNQAQVPSGAKDFERSVEIFTVLVEEQKQAEHAELLQLARQNHSVAMRHLTQQAGGAQGQQAPAGGNRGPNYDPNAVIPMREELTRVGVRELLTPEDVEGALEKEGTTLLVINSVWGCAAGGARPGAALALQHTVIPDDVTTVFAGMEKDAVDRARGFLSDFPPSSPFIALFKDGEVATALQRQDIEGSSPVEIAGKLADAFDEHCSKSGPSIPPEEFAKLETARVCGSTVPRAQAGS